MSSMISSFGGATGSWYESRAQASVMQENAELALMGAKYAAKDVREKTTELIGKQMTLYAKAGVDVSSGSPLVQMAFTREEGEKKARDIITKGRMEYAQGHWGARLVKKAGKMSAISQTSSGVASIIGMIIAAISGGAAGGVMGGISGGMSGGGGAGASGASGFGTFLNSLNANRPAIQ